MSYARAHTLQQALALSRTAEGPSRFGDVLLLLEHDPVVTLGRGATFDHVLAGEEDLLARGVSLVETERGGDVTFHGPGQLVAYPIFDLKPDRCDVRRYVRDLAEIMIRLARDHGVHAGVIPGDSKLIGVWVDETMPATWEEERAVASSRGETLANPPRLAKIGAIGVRLTRWISMHGFAFNVTTDLNGFRLIVPCGLTSLGVTSLAALQNAQARQGRLPLVEEVARRSIDHFAAVFDADVRFGETTDLAGWLPSDG